MKKQIVNFRHHPGLLLAFVVLIGAVTMVAAPIRPASAQADAPSWSVTGSLNEGRAGHSATLLPDGKVLVAGGTNFSGGRVHGLDSAELYDPVTRKWNATGGLNVPRAGHTATLLKDGKVLVVGGVDGRNFDITLNTAELYDPLTGTWSVTGSLNAPRSSHKATLLKNGKVLVAAGIEIIGFDEYIFLDTAELYDPETGTWSFTGSLNFFIEYSSATLLQNGKVLLLGGGSAELYDPDTETWSIVGIPVGSIGFLHTATLLPDGRVLIVGGTYVDGPIKAAQLYDPDTGAWSSTGKLKRARFGHTATLLPDGKVLVAGGDGLSVSGGMRSQVTLDSSELYDPDTGKWRFTDNLNTPRSHHRATLLSDGKVLLVGGFDGASIGGIKRVELGKFAAVPPTISMASVAGKKLIITGENFDDGAVILINGERQKTRNDDQNPQTTLIGKKAGKKVKPGDRIQVRNPDGAISEEFIFTGS
ncbi:MAG TPA: kelch repeat-containing protein [Blastocatellia bacterium]|nr:kelch repeat-containing protein [Blastocatellia bacterium]